MEDNIFEKENAVEDEVVQPAEEQTEVQQPVEEQTEVQQPENKDMSVKYLLESGKKKAQEIFANKDIYLNKVKEIPKKIWIMAGAGILAVISIILILSLVGNTYKTPVKAAEKLLNSKSVTKVIDNAPGLLNGFGEDEANKIIKIVKKSDQYEDAIEDAEEYFDEMIESVKDECGANYKIKIKVDEKEKLEKEDCKEFRENLRSVAKLADNIDDMDSDDYEDMADSMGITKSQAKDMVKTMESFCKKCKKAKVSAGYELDLVMSVTGSEMDEPQETEVTVRVFKVDGRWVPDVFTLVNMFGVRNITSLLGGLS